MLVEKSERLGCYAASGDRLLREIRFNISYPSSGIKNTNKNCLTHEDGIDNFSGDFVTKLPLLVA